MSVKPDSIHFVAIVQVQWVWETIDVTRWQLTIIAIRFIRRRRLLSDAGAMPYLYAMALYIVNVHLFEPHSEYRCMWGVWMFAFVCDCYSTDTIADQQNTVKEKHTLGRCILPVSLWLSIIFRWARLAIPSVADSVGIVFVLSHLGSDCLAEVEHGARQHGPTVSTQTRYTTVWLFHPTPHNILALNCFQNKINIKCVK